MTMTMTMTPGPRRRHRWRTRAAAAVLAAVLAGCVNLAAVGDYADAAGAVLSDKAAARRWRDSAKHLRAVSLPGDVCRITEIPNRPPQAEFDAAYDDIANVHAMLGAYFHAIGELASDRLPLPAATLSSSLAAIQRSGVSIEPGDEAAINTLGALLSHSLDAWRQQRLRALMARAEPDVDHAIALLQRLAALYADELQGERIQALAFVKCSIASGDLSDPYSGRRELKRIDAAYAAEAATLAKYAAALARVRTDHATIRHALVADRAAFSAALQRLLASRDELDAARLALSQLQGE